MHQVSCLDFVMQKEILTIELNLNIELNEAGNVVRPSIRFEANPR